MRPVFATNMKEATPRMKDFILNKVIPYLGKSTTTMTEFHQAEPWYLEVEDMTGARWVDGAWGARLVLAGSFSMVGTLYDLEGMARDANVCIDEVDVHPHTAGCLEFHMALSGRLSNPWEEEEE